MKGDLGSGKTTFTKGLAEFFGIKKTITSPTFVIVKEYPIKKAINGIDKLIHIDSYRIEEGGAESLDLDYYLNQPNSLVVIEWPEKIINLLPEKRIVKINFEYLSETERKIDVE